MKLGDLVWIVATCDDDKCGHGIYLGFGTRGEFREKMYKFLWKGRIATFDKPYWRFEVISESG